MSLCSTGGPSSFSLNNSWETARPRNTPLRNRSGTPVNTTGVPSIFAIDHESTKLRIPLSAVAPTQALQDDGLVPGVCRLYLEGRCRQGDRCFQVHVDPQTLQVLRQDALLEPSCCYFHGASCNYEGYPLGLTVAVTEPTRETEAGDTRAVVNKSQSPETSVAADDHTPSEEPKQVVVSLHFISPTRFLWDLYKGCGLQHLTVPRNRICKQHCKGLCRFGDECSYLHVCRQYCLDPNKQEANDHLNSTGIRQGQASHPLGGRSGSPNYNEQTHSVTHSLSQRQPLLLSPSGECTSFGGSLNNRTLGSHSFGNQESGKNRTQLLKPLRSTGTKNGSFSHNPYAEAGSLQ
ncbi:hypothetical protein AGDE_11757 [Angomonas deanei]|uniref:C3H1-type domain-containing protein n=1 Tax=Angomonas deanei TaxID=59799 RepID=A0A7G2CEN2_9TRYP|nr:hypothetical protein AGDE_11757 [Angomonas deanei]CAD2218330.1 hypothetical protein, conserved [Angomonas deanei]|eukprot:EPY25450.1 hypothetical protein AGDE_11757 [Angomonas deanei]